VQANVDLCATTAVILKAVELYQELSKVMDEKWREKLLKTAKQEHEKAWFPWTKSYWAKRIADPSLLWKHNRTHYNSPRYYHWTDSQLRAIIILRNRYRCGKVECQASDILLNSDELDLLNHTQTARKLIAGEDVA
jgi:hypothetical protein